MKTIKEEMKYIEKRNKLLKEIENYAESNGLTKVESDLFEDLFDFHETNIRFDLTKLIKLQDLNGKIYILRPDITTNIIKQVIPRMNDEKLKLYYLDKVYGYDIAGSMSSTRQFGVELIGLSGIESEINLLKLIKGLLSNYQLDYKIQLGNQQFVDLIIEEITNDKNIIVTVKQAIMKKNIDKLKNIFQEDNSYQTLLMMLLDSENDVKTIKKFIIVNDLKPVLLQAISRVTTIKETINSDKINIDLSLISPYDYYNGPIFKGYIKGNPKDIFRGGRYDTLTKTYGTFTKALGFSLDMDALMKEVF